MSTNEQNPFEQPDYSDDAMDQIADPSKEERTSNYKDVWFRAPDDAKGRKYRGSIICFETVDMLAVKRALEGNPKLSVEERKKIALEARQERAKSLNVAVEALTPVQLLDTSVIKIKKYAFYSKEGLGYIQKPSKISPEDTSTWAKLGDVKNSWGTLLLLYPTNRKGEILKDELRDGMIIKPWRMSGKTYPSLQKAFNSLGNNNVSLATQDLEITCDDPGYQTFSVAALGPAVWRSHEKLMHNLLEASIEHYKTFEKPFRVLTTEELKEKLNGDSGKPKVTLSSEGAPLLATGGDASSSAYDNILAKL